MGPKQIATEFAQVNYRFLSGTAKYVELNMVWQKLMRVCSDNDVVAESYANDAVRSYMLN